jgi:maleylpyruvate isomerase
VLRLYSYWRSSASWRVRIALAYKGVPFEYRPVHLVREGGEQYRADYRSINPFSQVPVLEIEVPGGPPQRITQSMAIIEYLEERVPAPPLFPDDPWLRARVRMLAEIINAGIQPLHNAPSVLGYVKGVLNADEQAFARHFLTRGLIALEGSAAETAKTFLVGDQPTLADVFLIPQLSSARRFGVELAAFPTLLRVEAACDVIPAFANARPERQPDAPPPGA